MSVLPDSLDNVVLGSMGEEEIEDTEFSLHSAIYNYTWQPCWPLLAVLYTATHSMA